MYVLCGRDQQQEVPWKERGDLLGTVVLVEGLKLAGRNGLVQQEECSKFLVSKQGADEELPYSILHFCIMGGYAFCLTAWITNR